MFWNVKQLLKLVNKKGQKIYEALRRSQKMHEKVLEGAPGFEPGTSRSAVECSTTELYPHDFITAH